ncbi:hypothetical protein, partial [Soonwooa sp.]|uniref:hypothetical protein n=1 Tax=Soonwooa sp. TaxID=1938592 RepID=UPI00289FFF2E
FDKHPAKIQIIKKAKLKNLSNPLTKSYATMAKGIYESNDINFAGHYILLEIGNTTHETSAVIADVKTGLVYDIPENNEPYSPDAVMRCLEDDNEAINTKANSNLLVINNFKDGEFTQPVRNEYLWNDITKKFKLIKSTKLKCTNK